MRPETLQIVATFYDSGGKLIGTESTFSAITQLRPAERSPFDLIFSSKEQARRIDSFNLTVSSDPPSPYSPQKPAALTLSLSEAYVDESSFKGGTDYLHIVGELKNVNGTETARFVEIVAALYDKEGQIVDTENTFTEPTDLVPGQSAPFDMTVWSPDSGTQQFDVHELADIINANTTTAALQSFNADSIEYSSILTQK